jgi:hypothetical protein
MYLINISFHSESKIRKQKKPDVFEFSVLHIFADSCNRDLKTVSLKVFFVVLSVLLPLAVLAEAEADAEAQPHAEAKAEAEAEADPSYGYGGWARPNYARYCTYSINK